MKSIVYLSEASESFSAQDIRTLALRSDARNRELSITGFLSSHEGRFIQYLEGEASPLDDLIDEIKNDQRHRFLHCLEKSHLNKRLFPDWGMRQILDSESKAFKLERLVELNLELLNNQLGQNYIFERLIWQQITLISRYAKNDGTIPLEAVAARQQSN